MVANEAVVYAEDFWHTGFLW